MSFESGQTVQPNMRGSSDDPSSIDLYKDRSYQLSSLSAINSYLSSPLTPSNSPSNSQSLPPETSPKPSDSYVLNPKGSTAAEVMGVDYKSTLRPALESYSQKTKKDSVETLDELILLQHQSTALSANIEEKRNDISTLQSRLDEVEAQLNLLRKETQEYTQRCEEEARNMMEEVKKEVHDMNTVKREAAEILQNSKLKLQEVTKQTEEETQKCAFELMAIIDSVSKYKEHVQSKIAEMKRDVSDTAAMLSDTHKGSLHSQYSFLLDLSTPTL